MSIVWGGAEWFDSENIIADDIEDRDLSRDVHDAMSKHEQNCISLDWLRVLGLGCIQYATYIVGEVIKGCVVDQNWNKSH